MVWTYEIDRVVSSGLSAMHHIDGALVDLPYRFKNFGKASPIGNTACFSQGHWHMSYLPRW
jgi:hypothetical protein